MGVPENIKLLRSHFELTQDELGKIAGVSGKAVHTWEIGTREPRMGAIQKIVDHFGLSKSALIEDNGILHALSNSYTESSTSDTHDSELTERDNKDIAKDVQRIMDKLTSGEDGPASYDGDPLSPESAELFREELEIALKRLKIINKEKYNPNKNKK